MQGGQDSEPNQADPVPGELRHKKAGTTPGRMEVKAKCLPWVEPGDEAESRVDTTHLELVSEGALAEKGVLHPGTAQTTWKPGASPPRRSSQVESPPGVSRLCSAHGRQLVAWEAAPRNVQGKARYRDGQLVRQVVSGSGRDLC